jgi:hypothetical protein
VGVRHVLRSNNYAWAKRGHGRAHENMPYDKAVTISWDREGLAHKRVHNS